MSQPVELPRWMDVALLPVVNLALALAVSGVVVMLVARRQGKAIVGTRLMLAGLALACVTLVLGYTVTTQREVLRARTRELVECTATARTSDLRDLLTEQTRIGAYNAAFAGVRGRDEVLDAVRAKIAEFGPLASHEIGPVQAIVDGTNIARTQVRVWVKPRKDLQYTGGAIGMWFRIEWRRAGEDGSDPWRASVITVMQIDLLGTNTEMGRD